MKTETTPAQFPSAASFEAEESRIHAVYERRSAAGRRYTWFDAGHLFTIQQLERRMLAAFKREGFVSLAGKNILEIGCGYGHWLRELIKWGADPAHLVGIDLLDNALERARRLSPAALRLMHANAAQPEFPDANFDIILQATVFTSILDRALKQRVAHEMLRMLRPGGVVLWYDFRVNNPRNPDVRGVKRAEIAALFPDCDVRLEAVTLAPPLARFLARYSWIACYFLSALPWACTHYLGTIRKSRSRSEACV